MRILCSDENVLDAVMMETLEKAATCCVKNEGLMPDDAEISLTFVSKESERLVRIAGAFVPVTIQPFFTSAVCTRHL